MKKQTLIIVGILSIVLITSIVSAGLLDTLGGIIGIKPTTSTVKLDQQQKQILTEKGIANLKAVETDCAGDSRCFNIQGDVNESLIKIPIQVCDKYVQIATPINISKMINITKQVCNGGGVIGTLEKDIGIKPKPICTTEITGTKMVTVTIIQRTKTNQCETYRDVSDDEVTRMVDGASQKKMDELTAVPNTTLNHTIKYGERVILG